MKKFYKFILTVVASIFVVILVFFLWMYYEYSYKPVKEAANSLLANHKQIEEVYSIDRVSGWGSVPEYSAIVKVGDEKCRVWTANQGDILESECKQEIK